MQQKERIMQPGHWVAIAIFITIAFIIVAYSTFPLAARIISTSTAVRNLNGEISQATHRRDNWPNRHYHQSEIDRLEEERHEFQNSEDSIVRFVSAVSRTAQDSTNRRTLVLMAYAYMFVMTISILAIGLFTGFLFIAYISGKRGKHRGNPRKKPGDQSIKIWRKPAPRTASSPHNPASTRRDRTS